jgi:phosphinothricin acetyltransferase
MTPDDVDVRPATEADLAAVAEIFAYYVTDTVVTFEQQPPALEAWVQRLTALRERAAPFLVADHGGRVVGYAYAGAWREKPSYRLTLEDTIYLAHDARGRGIGRRLLDALLRECREAGVRELIAVISDSGDRASEALHRRCGFHEAGRLRRVGFKHGRWLDTVLMQRSLAADSPDE